MEGGSKAWFTLHSNMPVMRVDDILHNFGPKSGPSDLPANGMIAKQTFTNFAWHAFAGVNDRHQDPPPAEFRLAPYGNRAIGRDFRQGIIHQVVKGIKQLALIRLN